MLDRALYVDYGQSDAQIEHDAATWSKFNFLTNWDEMFNQFKGFIFCRNSDEIRILLQKQDGAGEPVKAFQVSRSGFVDAVTGFDNWCNGQR
jgi:hypothetical protein